VGSRGSSPRTLVAAALALSLGCAQTDSRVGAPTTITVASLPCDAPGMALHDAAELVSAGRLRAALAEVIRAPAACAEAARRTAHELRAELGSLAPEEADAEVARAVELTSRGELTRARRSRAAGGGSSSTA
jgi:hypothetical protein